MALSVTGLSQDSLGLFLKDAKNLNRFQKAMELKTTLRRPVCTDTAQAVGTRDGQVVLVNYLGATITGTEYEGYLVILGPTANAVANDFTDVGFVLSDNGDGTVLETISNRCLHVKFASGTGRFQYRITAPAASQDANAGVEVGFFAKVSPEDWCLFGVCAHDNFA